MNAQDLRNSILKLAVQGKLVEQREDEGTAEELYKQIKEEKKKLIKEGKIRKQKALPPINEEEIPFEIPEDWIWGRLEVLIYSVGNKSNQIKQREVLAKGLYPVVSQSMNTIEGYSNQAEKLLKIEPLSVIVFGDHSKTLKLIDFDFIIGADGTKILVPILLNPKYIYYVLKYNLINTRDRGYSRHFQFLKEKLIPIPPLLEQKRIVEKIEELMPFVEKYDIAHTKLEELNKNFPEDIKKSILQYAVQGKLVEQREEEGTAEELYKQIQEEKKKLIKDGKIRKQKALPPIKEDEIPFEIPKSWKWVRLGECANYKSGVSYKKKDLGINTNNMIRILRGGNISDLEYFFKEDDIMIDISFVKDDLILRRNTLITPAVTSLEHVGKMARIDKNYNNVAVGGFVLMLIPYLDLDVFSEYMLFALSSPYSRNVCREITNKSGQAFYNLSRIKLMNILVPIPPLAEQKRIVEKIKELNPSIDRLFID